MNEKLSLCIKKYLSAHRKRKQFIAGIGVLSLCTVLLVYSFLQQPAISMERKQLVLESEQTEGCYTDILTVDIQAAAKMGQSETYFMISAEEIGASLSEQYAFDGDVELIDAGSEQILELKREQRDDDTIYWFMLEEGQTASFSLDCAMIDDTKDEADAGDSFPETRPEETKQGTEEETTLAVEEETTQAPAETKSEETEPEETTYAAPAEKPEMETPEITVSSNMAEIVKTALETTAANETKEEARESNEGAADVAQETKIPEQKPEESVQESESKTAAEEESQAGIPVKKDGKAHLNFKYTSGETLEECEDNLKNRFQLYDKQETFATFDFTWMSEAEFERLGQAAIEITTEDEIAEAGKKAYIYVEAGVETEASQKRIFTIEIDGQNAGLSKEYRFRNGSCKIKDDNDETIILHRQNKKSNGTELYWFTLKPGEETSFELKCAQGVPKASASDAEAATSSDAGGTETPEADSEVQMQPEAGVVVYAGTGRTQKDSRANGRNRKALTILWEDNRTISLQRKMPDGTLIILAAPREAFDDVKSLSLSVRELMPEEAETVKLLVEKEVQDNSELIEEIRLWDIKILSGGKEVQPLMPVTVTFKNVGEVTEGTKVFHVDEAAELVEDMNAVAERDGQVAIDTTHFSTYVITRVTAEPRADKKKPKVKDVKWKNNDKKKLEALSLVLDNSEQDIYYVLEFSDGAESWTVASEESDKTQKGQSEVVLTALSETLSGDATGSQNREIRAQYYKKDNKGNKKDPVYTESISMIQILNDLKDGFSSWLDNKNYEAFGRTEPRTLNDLYEAFAFFEELPVITLKLSFVPGDIKSARLSALVEPAIENAAYTWQYYEESSDLWKVLPVTTGASVVDITTDELKAVINANPRVRCRVESGGVLRGDSNIISVAFGDLYNQIVEEINDKLNLKNYPVGNGKTADLSIDGHQFNDLFYYENVKRDDRVEFEDAETYKQYLVELYTTNDNNIDVVKEAWETYLYDLYDPAKDMGNMTNMDKGTPPYPAGNYGDTGFAWPKDADKSKSSPFHAAATPVINPLDYSFLENGVDYSNFVTGLDKTAEGVAAGDANTERKYDIRITADAQAKAAAPVAMIFQIQTSWQMFDLAHANKQKDGNSDGTSVGGCANNTELANLYDIKQALLRLVDYVEETYPGNNLVMGITDVEHAGTFSMFQGTDAFQKPLYVTNDADKLRKGIIGWDTFGNCEHVHYESDALEAAVKNLESNLKGWKDTYGEAILYQDIQKVGIMIGGPTENTSGDSGYGVVLPWGTFQAAGLNSVYGIRVNEGTPVSANKDKLISWIDNSDNNKGTPFQDGAGTCFTEKYVASNEDAMFYALKTIVDREVLKKGIDLDAPNAFVENVTITDTIRPEFVLDGTHEIVAKILKKDGTVESATAINFAGAATTTDPEGNTTTTTADGNFTMVTAVDKTTRITYNFGDVKNTKKAMLEFRVIAREDYIGSNNAFTNAGTPDLTYEHKKADDSEPTRYEVETLDKPQVNVPIRFDTVDGEKTTILVGDTVDLKELSEAIVRDVEERAEKYEQINGILTYVWTLPEGGTANASVKIENGKIVGTEFPDRSHIFNGTTAGSYTGTLNVTFAPEATNDPDREAVNPLTKPGNVWIDVVDGNTDIKLHVKKVWKDGEPADIEEIQFRITGSAEGYEPWTVTDSKGEEITCTLKKSEDWKTVIEGLPAATADKKVITYQIVETPVPEGYFASYSMGSEDKMGAKVTLWFRMKHDKEAKGKNSCTITYRYGQGEDRTYRYAQKKDYVKGQLYTFELDIPFELDENNEPEKCDIISIQFESDKDSMNKIEEYGAEVETIVAGSTPCYIITNEKLITLPDTGGTGALPYTMAGSLMLFGAGLWYKKKRRGEEAQQTS